MLLLDMCKGCVCVCAITFNGICKIGSSKERLGLQIFKPKQGSK